MNLKICNKCKKERSSDDYHFIKRLDKLNNICKICVNKRRRLKYQQNSASIIDKQKKYYEKNKDNIKYYKKNYDEINSEKLSKYHKEYRDNNRGSINNKNKKYYLKNKKRIINQHNNYNKERRVSDPVFKIRASISTQISKAINKNKESCLKHLPYTLDDLIKHLESHFEPWMNWNNHGVYDASKWDNDDPNTWTWQIDHIVPHSSFKYVSMKDEVFKECWALENLRPLSAKENILKGNKELSVFICNSFK